MNNRAYKLTCLLVASTMSTSVWGAELNQNYFNGMQLAWTRVPSSSTEDAPVVTPKPKQVKPTVVKPAQPSVVIPRPVTSTPSKPTPTPLVTPTPIPVTKPTQPPVAQKVQPHISKESQTFKWVIGLGVDLGGEKLGTVTYSDGSTAPVNANSGLSFNIGGVVPNGKNSGFSTQVTLGYKSGGPKIWNNDVNWSAISLEAIEHYGSNNFRMGLGVSYQINPQLKVNLPSSSSISKYNNAIGLIAQIGWIPVRENYSIDLRYTAIKFQSNDLPNSPSTNGSVAGLYASFYF